MKNRERRIVERCYSTLIFLIGLGVTVLAVLHWETSDMQRFAWYAAMVIITSRFRLHLPVVPGAICMNFLFQLSGLMELSFSENVVLGWFGAVVQCMWKPGNQEEPLHVLFNASNIATAVALTFRFYHSYTFQYWSNLTPVLLPLAGSLLFLMTTAPRAGLTSMSVTNRKRIGVTWRSFYYWAMPLYLVGAFIAWAVVSLSRQVHWPSPLLFCPIIYFIYRMYVTRLQSDLEHMEEIAALHLRTIEALALAIEAKDHTTHTHLCRVQTYAVEMGKSLGLSEHDLRALHAAALLHDIGKLAVPDHIICKPGKLTQEEYEKVKIHPVVGAEILERVRFPYPVVPIVRAHHENWDGSGYPDGLKAEEIPVGARILAAVDYFDAMASDRWYRKAQGLEEVMQGIRKLAGTKFDPAVVKLLEGRYQELENLARASTANELRLSTTASPGSAPKVAAAGEEGEGQLGIDFLSHIVAARLEVQQLFELVRDLGCSLNLDETLSVVATRLRAMIPCDALVIYLLGEDGLRAEHAAGAKVRFFTRLRIPLGEGLSGLAAQQKTPIVNGDPLLESGEPIVEGEGKLFRSGLAVPLEGTSGVIGVITLYSRESDAFARDDLRLVLALGAKISFAIENAMRFGQAESSATIDYMTDLPNARSLFVRLESELERCKREGLYLTILVSDLDGFKDLNDRYGHLTGNAVLRSVADALRANCRDYDYVGRMGGDEFVLILPSVDRETAAIRIREFRSAVQEAGRDAGMPSLSMSVGAAYFPADGSDLKGLLAMADNRMYGSKQLNRIVHGNQRPAPMPEMLPALPLAAGASLYSPPEQRM